MSREVVLIIGPPASGKTTVTKPLVEQGYVQLSRDIAGGKVTDLVPDMIVALSDGKSVVMDNLFATVASRKPFVDAAVIRKVPIRCVLMDTALEDAQINALNRMWDRHGKIFFTQEDLKAVKNDPNMFPCAVLFKYRKEFEKPTTAEGFTTVEKQKFMRRPLGSEFTNKAVLLDFDDTLRKSTGSKPYPISISEIQALPGRTEILKQWEKKGYVLLGVSNQSAIAKKEFSMEDAHAMFAYTCKLLGVTIDVQFCPHRIPPMTCYCRKPQSGLAVHFIRKYNLDPKQCIMVGDATTDKTFAGRAGFQFVDQAEFFK